MIEALLGILVLGIAFIYGLLFIGRLWVDFLDATEPKWHCAACGKVIRIKDISTNLELDVTLEEYDHVEVMLPILVRVCGVCYRGS